MNGYAASLYMKACDGGVAAGCKRLGSLYERGVGVAEDSMRALELYDQACTAGDSEACDSARRLRGQP